MIFIFFSPQRVRHRRCYEKCRTFTYYHDARYQHAPFIIDISLNKMANFDRLALYELLGAVGQKSCCHDVTRTCARAYKSSRCAGLSRSRRDISFHYISPRHAASASTLLPPATAAHRSPHWFSSALIRRDGCHYARWHGWVEADNGVPYAIIMLWRCRAQSPYACVALPALVGHTTHNDLPWCQKIMRIDIAERLLLHAAAPASVIAMFLSASPEM